MREVLPMTDSILKAVVQGFGGRLGKRLNKTWTSRNLVLYMLWCSTHNDILDVYM